MSQLSGSPQAAIDYNSTIIGALELSEKKWVLAVQLPGVDRHSRHVLDACGERFVSFVERLKARCASAGRKIARVILTHEAGRDGFWLARFLARRGIEVHVMQPSSLPVDRRARRAKTDMIDAEMLLRTLMAWLRGEPRVCSMVPIPSEADEEARRAYREREYPSPACGSALRSNLRARPIAPDLRQEPGAGKPHAGICAGAGRNPCPYRDNSRSSTPSRRVAQNPGSDAAL